MDGLVTNVDCRLFPAKLNFLPAVRDAGRLAGDEETVWLTSDAVGLERLPDHRTLRTLWCSGIDDRRLGVLSQCESLQSLYIEDVKAHDLEPLAALRHLDVLSVDSATKVQSLSWLTRIRMLSQLRLQHFPKVRSLAELSAQRGIVALDVSGSMWTRMKVESFKPLSELTELRLLYLTNIVCLDATIQPLADLEQLQELHIAGFYAWQEFAKLSGLRPDLVCSWFQPYTDFEHQACCECRSNLVMLTGRRQPILCPKCDADRIQRHVDRFMRVKREAAQQADANGGRLDYPSFPSQ